MMAVMIGKRDITLILESLKTSEKRGRIKVGNAEFVDEQSRFIPALNCR